jgi:hypothetical protein
VEKGLTHAKMAKKAKIGKMALAFESANDADANATYATRYTLRACAHLPATATAAARAQTREREPRAPSPEPRIGIRPCML